MSASLALAATSEVYHGQLARFIRVVATGLLDAAAGGDQSEFARGRALRQFSSQRRQENVDLGVRVDLVHLSGCGPDAQGHQCPRETYLEQPNVALQRFKIPT